MSMKSTIIDFHFTAGRHGPRAGIVDTYEGHQGPIRGIDCHNSQGPIDFSHLFLTSSVDWTVKLWSLKVAISIAIVCNLHNFPIDVFRVRNRKTSRCTHLRITVIMFMTLLGPQFTRQFLQQWTVWVALTFGI